MFNWISDNMWKIGYIWYNVIVVIIEIEGNKIRFILLYHTFVTSNNIQGSEVTVSYPWDIISYYLGDTKVENGT